MTTHNTSERSYTLHFCVTVHQGLRRDGKTSRTMFLTSLKASIKARTPRPREVRNRGTIKSKTGPSSSGLTHIPTEAKNAELPNNPETTKHPRTEPQQKPGRDIVTRGLENKHR